MTPFEKIAQGSLKAETMEASVRMARVKAKMAEADEQDRAVEKQRLKDRKRALKNKMKGREEDEDEIPEMEEEYESEEEGSEDEDVPEMEEEEMEESDEEGSEEEIPEMEELEESDEEASEEEVPEMEDESEEVGLEAWVWSDCGCRMTRIECCRGSLSRIEISACCNSRVCHNTTIQLYEQ